MKAQTFDELSQEEFNQLIDGFIERGDDEMELSTFFTVMHELELKRCSKVIELEGEIVDDKIVFDTPAPLPVRPNEIYVGDTKIVLKLRTDS
jgi:predicted nucleotidyltransferase